MKIFLNFRIFCALFFCMFFSTAILVSNAKNDNAIGTVVSIEVYDAYFENGVPEYDYIQSGSGVLIDEYGTVATNEHVISVAPEEYELRGNPFIFVCIGRFVFVDNKCNYKASVTKKYDDIDLAFLSVNGILFDGDKVKNIDPYEFKFLKYNYVEVPKSEPQFGDEVVVIGYPFYTDNYTPVYDFGSIIKKPNTDTSEFGGDEFYYFTDTFITYGNSGGGAFNDNAEFIGMPTFVYNEIGGLLKYQHIFERYENDVKPKIDIREGNTSDIVSIKNEIIQETPFSDIGIFNPYYAPTFTLSIDELISGYADGSFRPYDSINRAEFSKLAYTLIDEDYKNPDLKNCFSDVKEEWFAESVCNLKNMGIIEGYGDGTFKPIENINFVEASKILGLLFDNSVQPSSPWYKSYVKTLEDKNSIPYTIRSFDHELTRGEVAVMIYSLYYQNDLPSEMTYEDITDGRLERINEFIEKLYKFIELSNEYENIGFKSNVNYYFEGEQIESCQRNFFMPEYDIYEDDAKSFAYLQCKDLKTGEITYNYGLTRNGYQMQYMGYNQPVFEPSFWALTIDAKAYRVLENLMYYPEHIHDIETSDGSNYNVKIDPLLGLTTRYENYHFSSVENADDFFYERMNYQPTYYELEFYFDGIGHLINFSFVETNGKYAFERDVKVDYWTTDISYDLTY